MLKVIFHVVELEKWQPTIDNAKDILQNDPEAKIEIICMSDAAALFGSYSGVSFDGLVNNLNVKFIIGEKGLAENNLNVDMLPFSVIVEPSAVTRIVRLQNEGYAYIRL